MKCKACGKKTEYENYEICMACYSCLQALIRDATPPDKWPPFLLKYFKEEVKSNDN